LDALEARKRATDTYFNLAVGDDKKRHVNALIQRGIGPT